MGGLKLPLDEAHSSARLCKRIGLNRPLGNTLRQIMPSMICCKSIKWLVCVPWRWHGLMQRFSPLIPFGEHWKKSAFWTKRCSVYGSVQGDIQLRIEIIRLLEEWGLTAVQPDDLVITSGVMQGLALVSQVLAKSGDNIVFDEPSYIGVLSIVKAQGLNPITVQNWA